MALSASLVAEQPFDPEGEDRPYIVADSARYARRGGGWVPTVGPTPLQPACVWVS